MNKKLAIVLAGIAVLTAVAWILIINQNKHSIPAFAWGGPRNISTLALLADDRGFFENSHVAFRQVDIQTGKMAMDALRSGDLDFGVLVDTNLAFAGFEQADDLRILACIMTKTDDALLITDSVLGSDPANWSNAVVGVTLGTTTHSFLVQWLESRGVQPGAVAFRNMPPPAIQAALINGSLKAGCLWQPFRNNVKAAESSGVTEIHDASVYTAQAMVVTTTRTMSSPGFIDAARAFLQALIKAELDLQQMPEEARQFMAEQLNIPLNVMEAIWNEYQPRVFLDESVLAGLQRQGSWIPAWVPEHAGKSPPDYGRFLYPEPLREAAPERVEGIP